MAEKRSAEHEGGQPVKKHRFNSASNSSKRHGQGVDETYGQRFAFGNLNAATVPRDEDLEWEDEADALSYLKSVRQQAEGIPHVLIAQKSGPELPTAEDGTVDRSIYEDGTGDFRGYYHDGAYTAYPDGYGEEVEGDYGEDEEEAAHAEDDESSEIKSEESSPGGPRNSNSAEIHEAYYITLTQRYLDLRAILQAKPPKTAIDALPPNHPIEVGGFGASPSPFKQWSGRLQGTDPLPAQVASMHKDSVLRLIRIVLNGKFFRRGQELRERTSRWIWALLARLPEKGELDHQEIGWVRELGKRAVLFMLSLAEADVLREQYGINGSGNSDEGEKVEVETGVDESLSQHESEDGQAPVLEQNNGSTAGSQGEEDSTEIQSRVPETKEPHATAKKPAKSADGIPSPLSDVEMEIDSDEEDGEVSTESQTLKESAADVEAAKARLLAQLESQNEDQMDVSETIANAESSSTAPGEVKTDEDDKSTQASMNLRATLNMILTVAGEFYGQRDLLEFRDPFGHAVEGTP
ncbi:hypothetical protein AB5N19_02138 [Seiridium cardinale]|uniref:Uncharacterized protein n=1 Tax=Seiridium cardinale TaxID=138064 RepID=A0ABR2XN82_9PEZI